VKPRDSTRRPAAAPGTGRSGGAAIAARTRAVGLSGTAALAGTRFLPGARRFEPISTGLLAAARTAGHTWHPSAALRTLAGLATATPLALPLPRRPGLAGLSKAARAIALLTPLLSDSARDARQMRIRRRGLPIIVLAVDVGPAPTGAALQSILWHPPIRASPLIGFRLDIVFVFVEVIECIACGEAIRAIERLGCEPVLLRPAAARLGCGPCGVSMMTTRSNRKHRRPTAPILRSRS
jgi:hypothetical protein